MKMLLIFFLITAASIPAQDLSMLLPDSIEVWKAEGNPEIYTGDNLYKLIDGGADIFLEYGFKSVFTRRYFDRDDNVISVEIYEMNDSAAAFGIFSLFTFKTGKPIVFSCDAYAGDGFLLFQKGNYYISLSGNESSEKIRKALVETAGRIEKNILPSDKPLLADYFRGFNYLRIAFIKGNLGFYNVTNIASRKNLNFSEGVCLKSDGGIYTVLKYNSDEDAAIKFQLLSDALKTYKIVDSAKSSILYKKDEKMFYRLEHYFEYIIISSGDDQEKSYGIPEEIKKILIR